jgi:hypothetical protein
MEKKIFSTPDSSSTSAYTSIFSKGEVRHTSIQTLALASSFTHMGKFTTALNASATLYLMILGSLPVYLPYFLLIIFVPIGKRLK